MYPVCRGTHREKLESVVTVVDIHPHLLEGRLQALTWAAPVLMHVNHCANRTSERQLAASCKATDMAVGFPVCLSYGLVVHSRRQYLSLSTISRFQSSSSLMATIRSFFFDILCTDTRHCSE